MELRFVANQSDQTYRPTSTVSDDGDEGSPLIWISSGANWVFPEEKKAIMKNSYYALHYIYFIHVYTMCIHENVQIYYVMYIYHNMYTCYERDFLCFDTHFLFILKCRHVSFFRHSSVYQVISKNYQLLCIYWVHRLYWFKLYNVYTRK